MGTPGSRADPTLKYQRPVQIEGRFGTDVFDASVAVGAQAVKAQTVGGGIDLCDQSSPQSHPLPRIDFTFEDRVLNALAEIKTSSGDAAQPTSASNCLSVHIIGHEHEHVLASFPNKTGIAVEIAP